MGKGHYLGGSTTFYLGSHGRSDDPVSIERVRAIEAKKKEDARVRRLKADEQQQAAQKKQKKRQVEQSAKLRLIRIEEKQSELFAKIQKEQKKLELQQDVERQYENNKKISTNLRNACKVEIQATIERIKKLNAKYDAIK